MEPHEHVAIHRASAFDFVAARKLSRVAHSSIAQADSVYGAGWVSTIHAMILLHEGDFALAHEGIRLERRYEVALPLTILATLAAVIASQALISGAFSLTAQASPISTARPISPRSWSNSSKPSPPYGQSQRFLPIRRSSASLS